MKVVFLDSLEMWSASWLDASLVARFPQLMEATKAVVVVSSSWRLRCTRDELAAILAERGFDGGVLDVTPRLARPPEGDALVRANEIAAWLADRADVESYVILDDHPDFGTLAARHVRVDPKVGLSDADVDRARAIVER